jgi:hypothetical protein
LKPALYDDKPATNRLSDGAGIVWNLKEFLTSYFTVGDESGFSQRWKD